MISIFSIIGKTASGKDYLRKNSVIFDHMNYNKPMTTRPKREGEDNDNYIFVDEGFDFTGSLCCTNYLIKPKVTWTYGHLWKQIKKGDNVSIYSIDSLNQLIERDLVPFVIKVETPYHIRERDYYLRVDEESEDTFASREARDFKVDDFPCDLLITRGRNNAYSYTLRESQEDFDYIDPTVLKWFVCFNYNDNLPCYLEDKGIDFRTKDGVCKFKYNKKLLKEIATKKAKYVQWGTVLFLDFDN